MKKNLIAACLFFLAAGGIGYYVYNFPQTTAEEKIVQIVPEEEVLAEEKTMFGIDVSELEIIEGVVEKNQTLSTILGPFNVPYQMIDKIAKKSKDILQVRHIAINKQNTLSTPKASSKPQSFIYEPNQFEYVVFKLDDVDVYKESNPVEVMRREVGGTISSSLYVNMVEQGVGPDLIDQFADLYGWTVDFQRLQQGDKFKVVYNEKWVDGQVVGI